ncbi:HAMP domain-containing sensor histidine kinase [Siphonobacter curvatus]|uniref:histidine kinase n=1 Tax=Siphonobacter curvatus TaxID=2094562 RepID=A0A2S7IQS5_9BACT|nr:ATP-binding protein [Siphonobacter curvatus]PQA59940.1 sensor histidine kinase [Siphonobacter curvatus]
MQIRTRLTIQFTLLVSVIVLLAFAAIYYFREYSLQEQFYKRLRQKALSTVELLVNQNEVNSEILKLIDQSNYDLLYKENVILYTYRNDIYHANNDTIRFDLDRNILNRIRLNKELRIDQGEYKLYGLYYTNDGERMVSVAGAADVADQVSMRSLLRIMLYAYVACILLVAVVGWFFAGRALVPISDVINEVQRIYPQNLSRRVNTQNEKDEIGRLTFTFNALLDRVEQAFRLQNMFISNVSHELKNPLTKIISQLEVVLLRERSTEEYRQTASSVLADARDLSQLSNTLLELAKVSDQNQPFLTAPVRIDEVLWDARDLLRSTHQSYTIKVEFPVDIEEDSVLTLNGNAYLLKVAAINLMENGCKFSIDHTVFVKVLPSSTQLELVFSNRSDIAQEELSLIFQPFYRSQKSVRISGYGIGLSLVDRIIKLHNGTIEVDSQEGNVTFRIVIPQPKSNFQ